MIYPTSRAILLAFFGVPLSLAAGLAAPGLWFLGIAWLLFVTVLIVADAMLGGLWSEMTVQQQIPAGLAIGTSADARFHVAIAAQQPRVARLCLRRVSRFAGTAAQDPSLR